MYYLFLFLLVACSTENFKPLPLKDPPYEQYWSEDQRKPTVASVSYKPVLKDGKVELCDGLPKIDIPSPPGICVGLLSSGLRRPRNIASLGNNFVLTDMGHWGASNGSVWYYQKKSDGTYSSQRLFSYLQTPHGIGVDPFSDSKNPVIFVGTATTIFKFNLLAVLQARKIKPDENPSELLEKVVTNMPGVNADGSEYRHGLKEFVFDEDGNLLVNVGSMSDNCDPGGKLPDPTKLCPESEGENGLGVIRKYILSRDRNVLKMQTIAHGLRNSMALLWNPETKTLLQAENSRDRINMRIPGMLSDAEEPKEELNVIEEGNHYGWPYCYNIDQAAPEFPSSDCRKFTSPYLLLPPHAAPLGMLYYRGKMFPTWFQGKLLLSFHGYRSYGHRIVVMDVDSQGLPKEPRYDLLYHWEQSDVRPKGAPVGLAIDSDGAILVPEDKNGTILKITCDFSKGDCLPKVETKPLDPSFSCAPKIEDEETRCQDLQSRLNSGNPLTKAQPFLDQKCVSCHSEGAFNLRKCDDTCNAKMLLHYGFINSNPSESEVLRRIQARNMPPDGFVNENDRNILINQLEEWIKTGMEVP